MIQYESKFFKILVVGDAGVGKTSLLYRYCFDKFDPYIQATTHMDFNTKIVTSENNQTIKIQLWDIAGNEQYKSVSKLYMRGAKGCLIVTDITNDQNFTNSLKWKEIIEQNCDYKNEYDDEPIPILLVQNKLDLLEKDTYKNKTITYSNLSNAKAFSDEHFYYDVAQTSAKTNEGVNELFQKLIDEVIRRETLNQQSMMINQSLNGKTNFDSQALGKASQQNLYKDKTKQSFKLQTSDQVKNFQRQTIGDDKTPSLPNNQKQCNC